MIPLVNEATAHALRPWSDGVSGRGLWLGGSARSAPHSSGATKLPLALGGAPMGQVGLLAGI